MFRRFFALATLTVTLAAPLLFAACQSTSTGAAAISPEDRIRFTTSKNLYRPDLAAQNRNLR